MLRRGFVARCYVRSQDYTIGMAVVNIYVFGERLKNADYERAIKI